MDWTTSKAACLAWYVQLSEAPGWKAQAWHSVNALAQRFPHDFGDLPQLLTAEMLRRKETADAPQ